MKSPHWWITRTFLPVLLLCLLAGCAVPDRTIRLDYTPVDRSFGRHSGDIIVTRSETPAPPRSATGEYVIGSYNNVHGVQLAEIRSGVTAGEWLTNALLTELKQLGYNASYVATVTPAAKRVIQLSDINAFVNVNRGTVSDEARQELKFDIDLLLDGVRVKTFTITTRDTRTVPLSVSVAELERIMLQSAQAAMLQIVPAINTQFNKK